MNKGRTKGWLGQPSIIKSLEHKFGEKAVKERLSLTPGTPRFTDRIPSTTPGAEPPRYARDSGSARSHSTHLETSSSDRP